MTYGIRQKPVIDRLELAKETIMDLAKVQVGTKGRLTPSCEEIPTFRAANALAGRPERAG